MRERTDVLAVVGTPIVHSLSPLLHNTLDARTGKGRAMIAVDPVNEAGFDAWCDEVRANEQFVGFCVTVPYKIRAAQLCARVSGLAKRIGAVNTVTRMADGTLSGDNTDAPGFLDAVCEELGFDPMGRSAILFGTGGVARAILVALVEGGATRVTVVSRTQASAEALIASIKGDEPCEFIAVDRAHSLEGAYDIAINATSLGLRDGDPLVCEIEWLENHCDLLFDAVYAKRGTTALVERARAAGMRAADGRRMLAYQAAIGAEIWGSVSSRAQARDVFVEVITTTLD